MEYVCTRCSKVYTNKGSLSNHLRYNCGIEPKFMCPLCSYRASRKENLRSHIFRRHENFCYFNMNKKNQNNADI
uniref:C2H2-type domain-containing protein n=1 Tax=Rhodnius prolixus TaxID=13249 RepID=A0A4P6DAV8_RHOPR